jgi:hypothetical protein
VNFSVTPWLSLFGAYYPRGEPLAAKAFTVDLHAPVALSTALRGELAFRAQVSAEGLARDAAATARLSWRAPDVLFRLTFSSDAGLAHEAVVAPRLGRRILRTLTELSGTMSAPEGATFLVRLRLNWRVLRSRGR